jgi:hypothetical protein
VAIVAAPNLGEILRNLSKGIAVSAIDQAIVSERCTKQYVQSAAIHAKCHFGQMAKSQCIARIVLEIWGEEIRTESVLEEGKTRSRRVFGLRLKKTKATMMLS